MATVSAYWRPAAVEDALALLERPRTVVIGGGTKVNAAPTAEPVEVVDLQALHLDRIERLAEDQLLLGATATLQQVADRGDLPACIRDAARRELPSTLRAQATVAGTVMTDDPESELLATLLVHDAVVLVAGRDGAAELRLADLLIDRSLLAGRLITALRIETGGVAASARVGRTRADRPIVAAVARRNLKGERRLAMSGVAATPVLVDGVEGLDPPADFRGSSEYRRAMAAVLAARVLEALS